MMKLNSYLTHCLLYGSCLWLLAGCIQREESTETTGPAELALTFIEDVVINEGELVPEDFLVLPVSSSFSEGKAQIYTDSEGNIFIPDHTSVTIRVFDADGNFLRNIGQEGGGPGEFSRISAIDIFEDELVVYDGGNRRIVRFSNSGDALSVHIPDGVTELYPVTLRQLDEDRYLFIRKLIDIEQSGIDEAPHYQSTFFHVYDRNRPHPSNSFGHIDSLMNNGSNFVRRYTSSFNTGRIWMESEDEFWFVPGIYDGRLFRFREGVDGWDMVEILEGYLLPPESVDLEAEGDGTMQIIVYFLRMEEYSGKIQSQSLGLFTLNDDRLIHISSQLYMGERQTIVEVFSSDGMIEGVGRLSELTYSENEKFAQIRPFWKDQDDRFYFLDVSQDSPVVRIGRIQGI